MPGFCSPFGLFRRGEGVQVCVAAFYRRSQGWTLLFRKTWTARPFSRRNSNPLLIFPSNAKDSPLIPFSGRLGKIFKLSAPIWTIFASLLELSPFRRSLLPSNRLRHSMKSTLATGPAWQMRLTRRVHSQKFPFNYSPLPNLVPRVSHRTAPWSECLPESERWQLNCWRDGWPSRYFVCTAGRVGCVVTKINQERDDALIMQM